MPYDSVYSEKRPPGTLRTAWRNFYGDATAMIGLYGCAGLAILCILVVGSRLMASTSSFLASAFAAVMVTLWRSLFLPRD